jgi:hypothetical protein
MEEAATNTVEGVHHRLVRLLVGVVVNRIYDLQRTLPLPNQT